MNLVYVLRSASSGRFYIGYTKDLEARVATHQRDEGGWTAGRGPWDLKYYETFSVDRDARCREIALKKAKSAVYLEWLCQNGPGTILV